MSSNNEHSILSKPFSCSYDETWPDLNSGRKAPNHLTSKLNSKLHSKPSNSISKGEERKYSNFTLAPNDCNMSTTNLPGFTKDNPNEQTVTTIAQHLSSNKSQSRTAFATLVKQTNNFAKKLGTHGGPFESFPNQGVLYDRDNSSLSTYNNLEKPKEEQKLGNFPTQLEGERKSEVVLRKEAQGLRSEHLQPDASGMQAVQPEFSLEQAAEDFPSLNSASSKKWKRVCKTVDNSQSYLEYGNEENKVTNGLLSKKTVEKSWKPKKKDPIQISLQTALLSKSHHEAKKNKAIPKKNDFSAQHNIQVGNPLDSDKPQQKRGKVRPDKEKKPTKLKSQVLLERSERQKMREELQAQNLTGYSCSITNFDQVKSPFDASFQKELGSLIENCTFLCPEIPSAFNNQECNDGKVHEEVQPVVRNKFHSRRFREYCTNWLTEDLTSSVVTLLEKVSLFQDRTFNQNPIKASAKRRYVAGISQTNKYLRVKKVKLLIIAPDLEKNSKEGGLDEKINYFIKEAECQGVPCVFGPNRKRLGRAVFKKALVSCVAIMNHEGAEDLLSKVLQNLQEAKEKYQSMMGLSPETGEEELDKCKNEEVPESSLDALSASLLATLREEPSPAEKLLKAIENEPT